MKITPRTTLADLVEWSKRAHDARIQATAMRSRAENEEWEEELQEILDAPVKELNAYLVGVQARILTITSNGRPENHPLREELWNGKATPEQLDDLVARQAVPA
jgi:hypothetical protein